MLPLAAMAVGIATKYIPELIGKSLGSKEAEQVSRVVINAAKKAYPDKPLAQALEDYEAFNLAKDAGVQEQLYANIRKVVELELADVQHARETGRGDDKLTYLLVVLCFAGIALVIFAFMQVLQMSLDEGSLAVVSAMLGGVLTLLTQQLQQISNYKYGSSIGSRMKELNKK